MNGTGLLGRVKVMYPDTVRMVLSAYTDSDITTEAITAALAFEVNTGDWSRTESRIQDCRVAPKTRPAAGMDAVTASRK